MGCELSMRVMDHDRQLPQQRPEIENNYYATPDNWSEPVPDIVRAARGPFGKPFLPGRGGPSAGTGGLWAGSYRPGLCGAPAEAAQAPMLVLRSSLSRAAAQQAPGRGR